MARKEAQGQDVKYLAIEELKETSKTPDAVYQGMCAANGWQKGRAVTPEEYQKAQQRFLGAATGRSEVMKNE